MTTVPVNVVTPEGSVGDYAATSVTLPTADGEITVLPGHIPLVSALQPGVVTLRVDGTDDVHLAVSGGFIDVTGRSVVILAETAERADQIDVERAERARRQAAELMAGKREHRELAEAQAEIQKSLARLRAVELAGHRPGRRPPKPSGEQP